MNLENLTEKNYSPVDVGVEYVKSLTELVDWCKTFDIELNDVKTYMGGFRVTFKGFEGDAICHAGSYGSPEYWESYGMPWDYDDVSTNEPGELVKKLAALRAGKDWKAC